MGLIKSLFSSKKFIGFFIGLLTLIASKVGLDVELTQEIAAITASYLVGQGVADHGKEKVKAEKEATPLVIKDTGV